MGAMNYQQILNNLGGYEKSGKATDFASGLEHVKEVLASLGSPQDKYPIIHVVGSKGKGSAVRLIEQGLVEAGKRVGSYYSPHVYRVNERIRIDGEEISDTDLDRVTNEVPTDGLTYFEFLTVCAFKYFAQRGVDYAVIEAGLGGRLDATNVAREPAAVVLTNVELEHTDLLGGTVEEIEREKLGVLRGDAKLFRDAGSVLDHFGYDLPREPAPLPGRFEKREIFGRECVLDMAHTVGSARFLRTQLDREYPGKKFLFVMSFLEGKNSRAVIDALVRDGDRVMLVEMDDPRAMKFDEAEPMPTSWPEDFVPVICGSARLLTKFS